MHEHRLRLADILVRPTQRLTKYGLLLAAIRKHVADENDAEALDSMVWEGDFFSLVYFFLFFFFFFVLFSLSSMFNF